MGSRWARSWNLDLVGEIGAALAGEARSKGARVLLAPTVNIHRSTLNGRNFECYSEDPCLSSEVAVAYISALQTRGVAATIKHFIGNEFEYQRDTISSDIDERPLREIYMPPFEAAVKRAKIWAVMTSYNRLNGTYVSERTDIVNGVLKREWGFDGLVMSDWSGTKSTAEALNGGLDLEMPGPARYRGEKLLEAYRDGKVSAHALREASLRLLRLIDRVGAFDDPVIPPERADDRAEVRALIRRAGAEGVVSLKNNGVLPLHPETGSTIAIIGPNAATAQIMGGGSAQINPHYRVTPLDALRDAIPSGVKVGYELGGVNQRIATLYESKVEAEFFDNKDFGGPAVHNRIMGEGFFMFVGHETPGFSPMNYSARLRSTYRPKESGDYQVSLIASGPSRLFVNGKLTVDAWDFKAGHEYFGVANNEVSGTVRMDAGEAYEIVVEHKSPELRNQHSLSVLRLGLSPVVGEEAIARAVALAAEREKRASLRRPQRGMGRRGPGPDRHRPSASTERIDFAGRCGEQEHRGRASERQPPRDALARSGRGRHSSLVSGSGSRQFDRRRSARQGGARRATAPDFPPATGRRPRLYQLSGRGRPCALWRRPLCRVSLLREKEDRAAIPVRLRPFLHAVPARRADPLRRGHRTGRNGRSLDRSGQRRRPRRLGRRAVLYCRR